MDNEYEIIKHNTINNFRMFLVNLVYREPHLHGDLEICYILEGSVTVRSKNQTLFLKQNDFVILNSCQAHELQTDDHALIVALQVASGFCKDYYPAISDIEFEFCSANMHLSPNIQETCFAAIIELAHHYFYKHAGFEFQCMSLLNLLFYHLITNLPYRIITGEEQNTILIRNQRIQRIVSHIESHYQEKLLLSDLAKIEDWSLSYLSHFFRDNFGLSFQEYLMSIRCEKAQQLLLSTNHNILNISLESGFSDIKYLNKSFQKRYGCTPKQYRKTFLTAEIPVVEKSMLSTQQVLSDISSLIILEQYYVNAEHIFATSHINEIL